MLRLFVYLSLFNDTSALVGQVVSSLIERTKKDKRARRREEREIQNRMVAYANDSGETAIIHSYVTLITTQDVKDLPHSFLKTT